MERRTSLFDNGLIWFGAGVSLAEILTGTYFSTLGFGKGFAAIIVGHVIGCVLLFLAGVIGGKSRLSAMETVKSSFGNKGGLFFALLNVLQLVGWTAIMIYDGALAAGGIFSSGHWIWCLVIGALIVVWIMVGITNLGKINTVAMTALFLLTLVLCKVIFFGGNTVLSQPDDSLSFGAAVELAVAMPLSWLPLISDYTREAEKPVAATAVSAVVYGLVSCWMYVIGMGASILTGESDIAQIMLKAGLSVIALIIVVFSTVTTTFLVFPMDDITGFLYLIGSVFAPMIAIQIADYFILHRDRRRTAFDARNLVIWVIGFVLYRILMNVDLPVGNTLPDMIITIVLCVIAGAVLH